MTPPPLEHRTRATASLAIPLVRARRLDVDGDGRQLGGKGAALARLIDAGYPVPSTGVITAEAYRTMVHGAAIEDEIRQLVATEDFDSAAIDALFARPDLPEHLADAITDLARTIGDGGPIAIRSSATVEDLHGSSFAGQYQSFLDINSGDSNAILETVRRVWASLWHPAPAAYRRAFATPEEDVAMAVVMMRMIPATTAGVVFTVDPGGSADHARVEAVAGLGESLVSGATTPDAWVVLREGRSEGELPPAVERALELSLDIEQRFGVPQDVEWAAIDNEVHIVQARPITVLDLDDGFDSAFDDHELTTAGIVEMVPGVLPPLLWDINHYILGEAFRSFLDTLGVIRGSAVEDRPFVRRLRGRVAIDFDQLREAASTVEGAVEQLEAQYFGRSDTEPIAADRASLGGRLSALRRDFRTMGARRRMIEQADVVVAATDELERRRPLLDSKTERELLAYGERLLDVAARGLVAELGVAATAGAAYERLVSLLRRYLGDGADNAAQLVTTGAAADIHRPPWASAALFGGPTWDELGTSPGDVRSRVRSEDADPIGQLETTLKSSHGWTRKRVLTGQLIDVRWHMVRNAIVEVTTQTGRREATKGAVLRLGGELRRVHLELGRRLVERGMLDAEVDVELLSTAEVSVALRHGDAPGSEVIRRRRNWMSRYVAEGPLPIRFTGEPRREPEPLPPGDRLIGWASSPGRYRGLARVMSGPTDPLEAGDVLVAVTTDASWSPAFIRAGAVVVEQGGPLSHAAILARELAIPAALNIEGATRLLDGCIVTVDGDGGSVVIEERGPSGRSLS